MAPLPLALRQIPELTPSGAAEERLTHLTVLPFSDFKWMLLVRCACLATLAAPRGSVASWGSWDAYGLELTTDVITDVTGIGLRIGEHEATCGLLPEAPEHRDLRLTRDHL